jgi:hypothetical protein
MKESHALKKDLIKRSTLKLKKKNTDRQKRKAPRKK